MPNPSGQFFVGRLRLGQPVWTRERRHLLCCGPSQTGKTESVLSHAVQLATGATVTTSTKDDFLVLPGNGRDGYVLDLIGGIDAHGMETLQYSPMSQIESFEDALLTARTLMDAAYSFAGSGVTNEAYWTQGGKSAAASLIWAARKAQPQRSIGDVYNMAAAQDVAEPLKYLGDGPGDRTARSILEGLTVKDSKGVARPSSSAAAIWSFARMALALYAYPGAAERAKRPNLDVNEFVRSKKTLHIVCRSSMAGELGPVIAVLIQALVDARYRAHAARTDRAKPEGNRLTLVLDEVANTAPLGSLPAVLSEGAGQGVSVVVGAQDRAQLITRFGEQAARTIVSNCRDRVIMPELGDRAFLEDIEVLAGPTSREESTVTMADSGDSASTVQRDVPRWPPHRIAQLAVGRALYLRGWTPHVVGLVHYRDRSEGDLKPAGPADANWTPAW